MNQQMAATNIAEPPSHIRKQRIRTFIIVLVVLNIPLFVLGLVDQLSPPTSLLGLIIPVVAFAYYGVYYLLWRAGYGEPATYSCLVLLAVFIAVGNHTVGGSLSVGSTLYVLMLIGTGLVLDHPRALDVAVVLCVIGFGGSVLYEFGVAPPEAFQEVYTAPRPLPVVTAVALMLITLIGTWLIMRNNLVELHRSTVARELARAEAEARARENADLAAQLQASNESLLTAQARLRETVEALALPLIPLEHGVALLPLLGYLDQERAGHLVEGMLHGIYAQRARAVIIDITGLREMDAHAAGALLQAANAARLLGAEVILSGISASAARALVGLGADMQSLQTAATLNDALRMLTTPRRSPTDSWHPK